MTLYRHAPLTDFTWCRGDNARKPSPFDGTTVTPSRLWSSTLGVLERELTHLNAQRVVLEVDVPAHHVRKDGQLRADSTARSPAVVLAFDSKHGSQRHPADAFVSRYVSRQGPHWQQNVRAIALTLEMLRRIDRYGAAGDGRQYTGFLALEAGSGAIASGMTSDDARAILLRAVEGRFAGADGLSAEALVKQARIATHPDRHGGDHSQHDLVLAAARTLRVPL